MRIIKGITRYKDPYSIEAPQWATELAFSKEEWNEVPGVGVCWWFINSTSRQWSHYNSPELYGKSFRGFGEDAVEIRPLNITLENK